MNLFFGKFYRIIVSVILLICMTLITVGANSFSVAKAQNNNANSSKKDFDKKDTLRAKQYSSSEKNTLLPVIQSTGTATSIYSVKPILFVSNDMQEATGNVAAINESMLAIKKWYSGALEQNNQGYIYNLENAIVFHAPQPFSYYKCPNHETTCDNYDGIWGNVQTELINAGYPLWNAGNSFVIFVKGAGGWAGSSCVPNCYQNWPYPGPASNAGISILGDWALDAITGTVNADCFAQMGSACYFDPQRGAIGHELGHTFGLAHANDTEGSIMLSWWNFPNVSLMNIPGNDEKTLLRSQSPFFTATACTYDSFNVEVVQPLTVVTGTQFASTFKVVNNGYCKWTPKRTSLRIIYDSVWGTTSKAVTNDVLPLQTHTFSLNLKAPTLAKSKLPTVKRSYWQVKMDTSFIGALMGNDIAITK